MTMTIEQPATLAATIQELGLTISAEFVPWSQSRSFKPQPKLADRSLNWKVTLKRNGRDILTTDYSAGIAHCLTYKLNPKEAHGRPTLAFAEAIAKECETGRAWSLSGGSVPLGKAPEPTAADVIYSLVQDASAIDEGTFEDWANSLGYDPDSRKAEATWKACVETGLKLRAALGGEGLRRLQEASQDY